MSTSSTSLHLLIAKLIAVETRASALTELSKKRDQFPELAPIIWNTAGAICALLQEIIAIYPLLYPPNLTERTSNSACNALALLQSVSSHKDTRTAFLDAQIPLFLYPFLNNAAKNKSCEYLRLTSLGVIGSLVKVDDKQVITFLLNTEIIPLCLRIMENGSDLSRTVATFIVHKILLSDQGLQSVCATADRFLAVNSVLSKMVTDLVAQPNDRLLRHILRCYFRLADNPKARGALAAACLPQPLRDGSLIAQLQAHSTPPVQAVDDGPSSAGNPTTTIQLIADLQRMLSPDPVVVRPPGPR